MPWPEWWAWLGGLTPMKLWLWGGNRMVTWTGLFFFWRRFRSRRLAWLWLVLLNSVSVGALVLVFVWLKHRTTTGGP